MSSTTMHFGPEWMRTKYQTPTRSQPPPSPPPSSTPMSGASTYSALVSPAPPLLPEKHDETRPFRYSKEELLRIYREGGGRGGLGLEVERWEGVVREIGNDPIGLREMNDFEKKLFQGPLNSDLRRRQSIDYLSPLSTQSLGTGVSRLNLNSPVSATASPLRERFGALRRRDSADQSPSIIPRKQSLSSLQPSVTSPREAALPSPRRSGYTSNFDGVLSSGDSWVARRRASEASLKPGSGISREAGGEYQQDNKASKIREEEEGIAHEYRRNIHADDNPHDLATASRSSNEEPAESKDSGFNANTTHFVTNGIPSPALLDNSPAGGPPNTIPDFATIEWSYKDPSGQIQGPFHAELMQKWFDDGYFTSDLPMKRTHLDSQWVTVGELARQHGGTKIFLTPPLPALPPGLTRRGDSQDQHLFNGPFQPAPLQSLRGSTLDSESPSSSFGGRFDNGSPDPNAFGERSTYLGDNPIAARASGFPGIVDPTATFSRRNTFNDPSLDSLSMRPAFSDNIPGRGPVSDGYGYNRAYSPGQTGWNIPLNNPGATFDNPNEGFGSVESSSFSSSLAHGTSSINHFGGIGSSQENGFGSSSTLDYNRYPSGPSRSQQYSHSPVIPYANPQNLEQSDSPLIPYGQQGATPQVVSSNPQGGQLLNQPPSPSQSPWNSEASSTTRRQGPFDATHPTTANTRVVQHVAPVEVSPWGPPPRPNSQEPWFTPQSAEEAWTNAPASSDSLTSSNVSLHDKQQQQPVPLKAAESIIELPDQPYIVPLLEPTISLDTTPKIASSAKSKNKISTQANQLPTPKSTHSTSQVVSESAPNPAISKAAWSKEDGVTKMKPSGVSISLRDIQEAEAKKAEARKVVEREKERVVRTTVPTVEVKDSTQPFTASWGLPTSQAGVRPVAPTKDGNTSPNSTTAPVWTAVAKPTISKKTMKEIQEEEEKRKKNAVKETTAAVAARRAYAETTQKVTSPAQGNAWTTVGPNGKPSTTAATVITTTPARPTVLPPTLSAANSSVRMNGNTALRSVPVSPTIKTAPLAARIDDPVPPSHDFLRWLSSSLKGLNSTVNVEEIISMLLSFPMDPDPSTVELISELIYANSTTLDGRRFAAEFIAKRKADAASRPKGVAASGKPSGKPISIADVVKATPKPTQPEWGFKVVNKKKKGGRA